MPNLYEADLVLPSIDWNDDGDYSDALEDVRAYWHAIRFGFGTHRRSNPQRPTADFGSGEIVLLGDQFVPGTSTDLTEAQIQRRHRLRLRQGPTELVDAWVQEGKHISDSLVAFRLEGLLERASREQKEITQSDESTTSTNAAVVNLLRNAFGLASLPINLNSTPLSAYEFKGPASRYASEFGQVSGGFPTADGRGGLGLYDSTKRPRGLTIYSSADYLISQATTEFDQEQLWNAALIQYDGPETIHSGTGTGTVTDPGSNSSSGVLTALGIDNPASGFRVEDLAARLTVGAATGQWRELQGDPGSGNGTGTVTDPGQSDLRGVSTSLTLNDPATGHVIEELDATLTVGAATGTWREVEGDPGSGTGSGTVTDPGAFGASGVTTGLTIANPDANHRVEDMDATFTVGAATASYTIDDRNRNRNSTGNAGGINGTPWFRSVSETLSANDRIVDASAALSVAAGTSSAANTPDPSGIPLVSSEPRVSGGTVSVELTFNNISQGTFTGRSFNGQTYNLWVDTRVPTSGIFAVYYGYRSSDGLIFIISTRNSTADRFTVGTISAVWAASISHTVNFQYTITDRTSYSLPAPSRRTAPSWEVERVGRSQNPNNRNNSFARVTLVGTDAPGTWRINDSGTNVDVSSWEHSTGGKTYRLGGIAVSFAITWKLRDTRTHTVTPTLRSAPEWEVDRVGRSTDSTNRNRKFVRVTVANVHEPGTWRINDGTRNVDLDTWTHEANRREYRITGIAVRFAVTWRTRDTRTHTVTPTRRTAPAWEVSEVGRSQDRNDPSQSLVRVTLQGTNNPGTWRINDGTRNVDLDTWTHEANRREYRILTIAVSFAVTWTLDDENVYDLTASNAASVSAWGRRELMFPVWFARTATAALQQRINALAVPRDIHVVDFSMWQYDQARTRRVAAIKPGDYIGIHVEDPQTLTAINAFVFVMHVEYIFRRNHIPIKRLTCIQTGGMDTAFTTELQWGDELLHWNGETLEW